jgi:hypothetical protein
MVVSGQCHALADLHPVKRPSTHCTGGCVGPRDSLDKCGEKKITCTHQGSNPKPSSL